MVQAVKITSLNDIGTGIMYTTLVPVVNMTGIPTTEKANLQIVGNLILSGAGGSYFPPAAQATVSQYVAYAAQPNITSVGTLTSLDVLGNINAGNANLGNLAIANVFSGTLNGSAVSADVANTVAVNAQPNITSVGTLTSLNVTGLANLGAVTNITITGGSPNYVLQTDGFGTLSWAEQTGGGGNANTGNITFTNANISTNLADTDIQIIGNGTGNVNVVANSQVWTFGADGNLTIPNDHGNIGSVYNNGIDIIAPIGGYAELASGNLNNFMYVQDQGAYINTDRNGDDYQWFFDTTGNLTLPDTTSIIAAAAIAIEANSTGNTTGLGLNGDADAILYAHANIIINTDVNNTDNIWIFGADGVLTLPNADVTGHGNIYFEENSSTITFGLDDNTVSRTYSFGFNNMTIPGDVNLPLVAKLNSGGIGVTNAAEFGTAVTVNGSNVINGSQIYMGAGTAESRAIVNSTGNSLMYTGVENPGFAGMVSLDPGVTSEYAIQVGSNNQIEIGAVVGPITTPEYVAGLGVLNDTGNINGIFANANVTVIGAGDLGWSFDPTGNLTMPGNIIVDVAGDAIIGSSSNVNVSAGGNTWTFGTDGNLQLPDSGLVWNNGGLTTLQAGSDGAQIGSNDGQSYVIANANGAYMQTLADTSNYLWHFGTAGNLTLPGILMARASDNGSIVFSNNGVDTNGSLKVDAGFNMTINANSNFYVKQNGSDRLAITTGNTDLMASTNVVIHANKTGSEQNWIFDSTGNLTTPNDISIRGANINWVGQFGNINWGPNANTYGMNFSQYGRVGVNTDVYANANVIGAQYLKGDGSNISNISVAKIANGTSNVNIPTSNSNVVITANGSANWTFGTDGTLNLPETTSAGNAIIQSIYNIELNSTGNIWNFGTDGNLTLPASGTISDFDAGPPNSTGTSLNGIDYSQLYWNGNIGNGNPYDGSDLYTWAYVDANGFNIKHRDVGNSINNIWNFIANGNTTLPSTGTADLGNLAIANNFSTNGSGGDITLTGGNINGANVVAANTFLGTGNLHLQPNPANTDAYLDVYLTTGPDIHIAGNGENLILGSDTGANVMLGASGNVTIQSNTGTPHTWTFGPDDNLTLPYGAVIKDTVSNAVSFGRFAGLTLQKRFAVAVGWSAGSNTQGNSSVAIGPAAGYDTQGLFSVAVGDSAGANTQSSQAVAIGSSAGQNVQGFSSIAIGSSAGFNNQGNYAVAIGTFAGTTSQASNSIILNATSANLEQTTANTFTVAPVRNDTSNIAEVMFYNTASKEVTYGNTISIAGNITAGNIVTGTGTTGNITGANVISANTFQSTVVAFSALPAATTPGLRAFINNGNLVAVGNFGAQVAGGGANYVPVFSDGANWCIG